VRALLTAVQFLTRLPVPGGHAPASPRVLRAAVRWFPLVGAAVGGITAGLAWAGAQLWPLGLALLVALAFEAWLTGAFHEDAVADFFDAFGGGMTRERTLEILRDSRIGSFGTVALIFALALRFGAAVSLALPTLLAALIAAAALGRWLILPAMALLPPVQGRDGLAKDVGQRIAPWEVGLGLLLAAPGVAWWAWLQPTRALIALGVLAGVLTVFLSVVRRRLGGITGDCLGCLCYLGQLAVLLTAAARWPG
jgi:adenosylcobinamide-GDP ribazoletransferase